MNEPLYLFKLNEETGEVKKYTITDYEDGRAHWSSNLAFRSYKISGTRYYCYDTDLDMFKNGRVYSWDDSIEHARSIMATSIKKRRAKANREYKKWDKLFKRLMGEPVKDTIEDEIDKLQTYKLFVGSDEIYMSKDDVKEILKGKR